MSLNLVEYSDSESLTDSDADEMSNSQGFEDVTVTSAVSCSKNEDKVPGKVVDKDRNVEKDCVLDEKKITREDDYFALQDSEEEDEKSLGCPQAKCCHSDTSSLGLSSPGSEFWIGTSQTDDWALPQKVWNTVDSENKVKPSTLSIAKPSHSSQKCRNPRHDLYTKGYTSKRQKLESLIQDDQIVSETMGELPGKNFFFVHHKTALALHQQEKSRIPSQRFVGLDGHAGPVNRISWCCPQYSHLLASAGSDTLVKIWNVFSGASHNVQVLRQHQKAVKDVAWSPCGRELISCGFDRTARHWDVQNGKQLSVFHHDTFVTCIKYHPFNADLLVTGCCDSVQCWDIRCPNNPVRTFSYKESFGQVQDVLFVGEGGQIVMCSDLVSRDSADKNIMVFDFETGVVLSNQVYHERYTCTRLCLHPYSGEMMAQTNGSYLVLFASKRPYKMNRCKRFDSHKVLGYSIGCGFSPDGRVVVSGSADGKMAFYNYERGCLLRQVDTKEEICLDVCWHPVLPSTLASSSWAGHISVWN